MAENTSSLPTAQSRPSNPHWLNDIAKRLVDILASAVALILLAPAFVIIAIGIKRDSHGPVFYRGPRLGKNGKKFGILKFRTMFETQESYQGARVTAGDDPRVTRFGRRLRDSKLNELPQFWNVLMGDMSLVGPRPEDPEIAVTWPKDMRREVLSVRPGITSPASVLYRNEEELLSSGKVMNIYMDSILPSKLRLDQLYVRNRSFLLDLDILFWTFLVLLPKVGSYAPPEASLFSGPISRLIERYLSWFTIDMLVTLTAMGLAGLIYRTQAPLNLGLPKAIAFSFGFAVLFSLTGALMGVNRIAWARANATDVFDLLPAAIVATFVALLAGHFLQPEVFLPSGMILLASLLAFVGFIVVRYRSRLISGTASRWLRLRGGARAAQERVLIIGGGEAGQFAAWLINTGRNLGVFHIAGFVDDDLYKQGLRIQGVNVLGQREDIPRLVADNDIGILIFAIHNISSQERQELLEICAGTPARVVMMPDFLAALNSAADWKAGLDGNLGVPAWQNLEASPGSPKGRRTYEIDHLLVQLDEALREGDIEAARKQAHAIRVSLFRGEVPTTPVEWVQQMRSGLK